MSKSNRKPKAPPSDLDLLPEILRTALPAEQMSCLEDMRKEVLRQTHRGVRDDLTLGERRAEALRLKARLEVLNVLLGQPTPAPEAFGRIARKLETALDLLPKGKNSTHVQLLLTNALAIARKEKATRTIDQLAKEDSV